MLFVLDFFFFPRYYYAVFEFDSIAAADLIYLLLNGSHGPIMFDLRFIADSVEFNHQPHVIATTVFFKCLSVSTGYEDD